METYFMDTLVTAQIQLLFLSLQACPAETSVFVVVV